MGKRLLPCVYPRALKEGERNLATLPLAGIVTTAIERKQRGIDHESVTRGAALLRLSLEIARFSEGWTTISFECGLSKIGWSLCGLLAGLGLTSAFMFLQLQPRSSFGYSRPETAIIAAAISVACFGLLAAIFCYRDNVETDFWERLRLNSERSRVVEGSLSSDQDAGTVIQSVVAALGALFAAVLLGWPWWLWPVCGLLLVNVLRLFVSQDPDLVRRSWLTYTVCFFDARLVSLVLCSTLVVFIIIIIFVGPNSGVESLDVADWMDIKPAMAEWLLGLVEPASGPATHHGGLEIIRTGVVALLGALLILVVMIVVDAADEYRAAFGAAYSPGQYFGGLFESEGKEEVSLRALLICSALLGCGSLAVGVLLARDVLNFYFASDHGRNSGESLAWAYGLLERSTSAIGTWAGLLLIIVYTLPLIGYVMAIALRISLKVRDIRSYWFGNPKWLQREGPIPIAVADDASTGIRVAWMPRGPIIVIERALAARVKNARTPEDILKAIQYHELGHIRFSVGRAFWANFLLSATGLPGLAHLWSSPLREELEADRLAAKAAGLNALKQAIVLMSVPRLGSPDRGRVHMELKRLWREYWNLFGNRMVIGYAHPPLYERLSAVGHHSIEAQPRTISKPPTGWRILLFETAGAACGAALLILAIMLWSLIVYS